MKIKVNDTVVVITGKYKGKQGKVLRTDAKGRRIVVEGVNMVSKHEKARRANETSRIVTEESFIDVSNVEVICDKCGKATRVGHTILDGKKIRICKKCGASLDKAYVKKVKKAAEAAPEAAPKKRTRKRTQKTAETPAEGAAETKE